MDSDLRAIADVLEQMDRPRGVLPSARVVSIDLDADRVLWSDGRLAPIVPVRYVA